MAARIGSAKLATQEGRGVTVDVGRGVLVGDAVGVDVDVEVAVIMGVTVVKGLETAGKVLRPNHNKTPPIPRSTIAIRKPYDR